jgi:hypothetical protein
VPLFLATIAGSNFANALNAAEQGRLQNINGANLAALDMPRLADAVILHVAGAAPRAAVLAAHKSNVEGALVVASPKEVSAKEENVFKRVLDKATTKSRGKEAPSVVALAALEPEMSAGVAALQAQVQANNQAMGDINAFTRNAAFTSGDVASDGLPGRGGHMNMARWLPHHTVAPALDVAANAWAQQMAVSGGGNYQAEIVRLFGAAPANVTARMIEYSDLDVAVKRRYYREVLGITLATGRQRATHAWREYTLDTLPGCPYVEFTAENAGGLSRYVWDYVNDLYYVGVHYNWVLGYNPFFRVTGLPGSF